jgi:hypothetical protein
MRLLQQEEPTMHVFLWKGICPGAGGPEPVLRLWKIQVYAKDCAPDHLLHGLQRSVKFEESITIDHGERVGEWTWSVSDFHVDVE